jgi:phosphoglycolate phosphatase-like HAD superfamily hydrolase
LVFWDFDGAIKDTVHLKGEAFAGLFGAHGKGLADKIRKHHASHGGLFRFEKILLYLGWAGLAQDPKTVRAFCDQFSQMVLRGVVEAAWVPGVEKILRQNPFRQKFCLVTATPQKEMETILTALQLEGSFDMVFGAPTSKSDAIGKTLKVFGIPKHHCLFIGDSMADQQAALNTRIPFLLREHPNNCNLAWITSPSRIHDFLHP